MTESEKRWFPFQHSCLLSGWYPWAMHYFGSFYICHCYIIILSMFSDLCVCVLSFLKKYFAAIFLCLHLCVVARAHCTIAFIFCVVVWERMSMVFVKMLRPVDFEPLRRRQIVDLPIRYWYEELNVFSFMRRNTLVWEVFHAPSHVTRQVACCVTWLSYVAGLRAFETLLLKCKRSYIYLTLNESLWCVTWW